MLPWMERMLEEVLMVEEGIWVSGGDSPFYVISTGKGGGGSYISLPGTKGSPISEMSASGRKGNWPSREEGLHKGWDSMCHG